MAPLPKRKHSTARKGKRISSLKKAVQAVAKCPNCGKPKQPHRECTFC